MLLLLFCCDDQPSCSAQGAGQENVGIYVKSIVRGGAAEMVRSWHIVGSASDLLTFYDLTWEEFNWALCGHCVQSGRLAAGDQLLSVDAQSLVGLCQERWPHDSMCNTHTCTCVLSVPSLIFNRYVSLDVRLQLMTFWRQQSRRSNGSNWDYFRFWDQI